MAKDGEDVGSTWSSQNPAGKISKTREDVR